ncbi:MAG: FlgD immunoglobulin-like domain containing protein [Candidatus Eisenbacteria bacterium]
MTARRSVTALVPAILLLACFGSAALLPYRALAQVSGDPPAGLSLPDSILTGIQVSGIRTVVPCETESVRVVLSGFLPSNCYSIRRVEVVHLRCYPCAPMVRLLVDDGGCLGRPCVAGPFAWKRELVYGPLPAGNYQQTVLISNGTCLDTFPPAPPLTVSKPFAVSPRYLCGLPPAPCLFTDWSLNDPSSGCNATLDPEGHARLAVRVFTPVSLQGLQGRLRLSNDSLRITSVVPIGPAAGMTLVWEPLEHGASFVMFSASGAPIPANVDGQMPPEILSVGVSVREGRRAPRVTYLSDEDVLGADAEGREVRPCPSLDLRIRGTSICAAPPLCDANGDGRTNVRDLVTMLLCLRSACPDSSRFDCDGDLRFAIADVLCCARRVLRTPPVTGDTPRPGAGARVAFGAAQRTATGWRISLTLTGIRDAGAARLALRFPNDRFQIADVAQQPGAPNWLSLFETEGGELSVGLLNLATGSTEAPWADRLEVAIELTLREGQSPGGSLDFAGADFSAHDGAALAVTLPATGLRIPSGVSLSASRPNPFSGSTRLVLSLEGQSEVRVSVHDLSGRRIATLLDGRFEAGQRDLRWSGRDDSGAEVRDGIYFVRCAGGGQETAQKVIRLRSR